MPVSAKITFVQGLSTPPAGEALIGELTTPVTCSNDDNSNVALFEWEMVDRPPTSAVPLGIVAVGTVPTFQFVPDQRGGYLLHLTVTDLAGNRAEDFRVFQVPETTGHLIPPFSALAPALNFAGQLRGWAKPLEELLRFLLAGGGSSGGGWQTALDLDFTAEATQTIAPDGDYVIGGLTWNKQNSANEQTAMELTNGVGLVIQPDTSDYAAAARSAPLLWLPLSELGIADLDWSTQFRVWVWMSDSYAIGFEVNARTFVGIDSNSLLWSPGWFATGLNAAAQRILSSGSRYNSTGGEGSVSPGTFAGNDSNILRARIGKIGSPLIETVADWAPSGSPWPTPGDAGFRPAIGDSQFHTAVDLLTKIDVGDVGAGAALGIVLGAREDNSFVDYVSTIKRIRVDYKL